MKIAYCSDLHLEFDFLTLKNEGAEVLILAGDICVSEDLVEYSSQSFMIGTKTQKIHEFFINTCKQFPYVIYVAGNHEHYHGDFKYTIPHLKKMLGYIKNLKILDREVFTHQDVTFVGSTLWTDMNKMDPLTMHSIVRRMSDFHVIENSNRMHSKIVPTYKKNPNFTEDGKNGAMYLKDENGYYIKDGDKTINVPSKFSPEDVVVEHMRSLDYIRHVHDNLPPWEHMVVVGHHTPSFASCHPRWSADKEMNGAYHSDLSEFILDRPAIKLWFHGHTHETYDYMIGSTRVLCNPRGYKGHEDIAETFTLKYVELE